METSPMKMTRKNSDPMALSQYQLDTLENLGQEFLRNFDSFDLEEVVRYGRMKSESFTREILTAWAQSWIQELVSSNKAIRIAGCYDYDIIKLTTLS